MKACSVILSVLLSLGLTAQDTRVILVRHAEKASEERDAALSDTGRRRASALAEELLPLAPAGLFATERRRTQETLAPLARRTRLAVRVKDPMDSQGTAAEILAKHRGQVVVACGHSDTLGEIAAGLGYRGFFPVVTGFDRIWILDLPAKAGPPVLKERIQAFRP